MNEGSTPPDINPYAPPSVPDPLLADRGPSGAWRDGKYLVVHRSGGALPHICLLTGLPAEMRLPVQIRWSYPVDFSMRDTKLEIGLTIEASRKNGRYGNFGCAANILSVVGVIVLVAFGPVLWGPLTFVMFVAIGLSAASGAIIAHYTQFLRFSKARGEYIWLRGAGPRFLEQLPVWPGTR